MLRQLSRATGMVAVAAPVALPALALAQPEAPPIVVVFSFTNNALGKDHADYDGMSKGVQDLLITDLATNAKIRLVDRSRLQDLLAEQNLTRGDDVLGLIGQLSSKVSGNLNLAPKPGAARRGDDGAKTGASQSAAPAASPAAKAALATENYAKPLAKPEAIKTTKLDVAFMKIYSNALDELDRKYTVKARQLFQQVADKYPDFEPAQHNLRNLQAKASN